MKQVLWNANYWQLKCFVDLQSSVGCDANLCDYFIALVFVVKKMHGLYPGSLCLLIIYDGIDGLMQKRHNSIANTLEFCLFCIKPSKLSLNSQ